MAGQNSRDVKRRIKSVSNTQKITKALQTVSAVKMRKAQARAIAGRPYAEDALFLLRRLSGVTATDQHELLKVKNTGTQLLVIIAPDKGLTGSLASNLMRKVADLIKDQRENKKRSTHVVAIGREAENFAERSGYKIVKSMPNENISIKEARRLKNDLVKLFIEQGYDKVILAYTQFISTLKQKPFIRGILPVTVEKIIDVEELPENLAKKSASLNREDYELEPSPKYLLDELIPDLVTMLIYHALLEASASEHSARMLAMKNAHDNAVELIEELTQTYNRLRQESITSALAEISAGVAALETN